MAELVDALVSNTSAARHAGSIPALGTFQNNSKSRKQLILRHLRDFHHFTTPLYLLHICSTSLSLHFSSLSSWQLYVSSQLLPS